MRSSRLSKQFRKYKDTVFFAVCLVFSLLLLTFSTPAGIRGFGKIGFSLISGLQKGYYGVVDFFSGTINSISELKKLKTEYDELKKTVEENYHFLNTLENLRIENELLKEQMHISRQLTYEHITTNVIAKDPGNFHSYFKIGCGSREGVQKYMPVIVSQRGKYGLVGLVIMTGYSTSDVMPLFSNGCSVAARLMESRYDGLVSGLGYTSDYILMEYVSQAANDEIKIGDLVVTSGMQSIYPYGIPIGYVDQIVSGKGETTITLYLKPVIEFSQLEYVQVLKAKTPEL